MSGNFARGFLQTFGPTVERNRAERYDMYKSMYSDLMDQRDELKERRLQDQKNIKLAKDLVAGTDAPEGAWIEAYNRLNNGMSIDQVEEFLANTEFLPKDLPAGQVGQGQKPPLSEQQQMEALGSQPQQETPAPTNPLARIAQRLTNPRQADMNSNVDRLSRETGIPREEIKKLLTQGASGAYTPPPEVSQAPAMDFKHMNRKGGNVPNVVYDARQKINSDPEIRKMRQHIRASELGVKSLTNNVFGAVDIVKNNPAVLTDVVSGTATVYANLRQELEAALDIFGGNLEAIDSDESNAYIQQQVAKTQNDIKAVESGSLFQELDRLSRDRVLFEMKRNLAAYQLASLYQQEGRSLSEEERRLFTEALKAGTSPEKYFQNMSVLLNTEIDRVNDLYEDFNSDAMIKEYNSMFSQYPMENYSGDLKSELVKDPRTKAGFDFIDKYNPDASKSGAVPTGTGTGQGGVRLIGVDEAGKKVYQDEQGNTYTEE